MKMNKVMHIAWKGLVKNKVRALLTMLGVIIGVAAVIVMVGISAGTEATIAEQINSLGTDLLFVSSSFTRGGPGSGGGQGSSANILTFDDVVLMEESINGIAGISTDRSSTQTVKANSVTLDEVSLIGTTPDYPEVRELAIDEGRFFTDQELDRKTKVVVLGSALAEELFADADPIGQDVAVGGTKFTVVGVMEEKGIVNGQNLDMVVFMPITVVFQKFTNTKSARITGDPVSMVYVQAEPDVDVENLILNIQIWLAESKGFLLEEIPFSVQTQQDLINTQEATTEAFRSLLAWVAAVSLVVGGIGIMNIMLVSVTERTREIGVRQSMGATPQDIRSQFLTEALMLSLVGGLLGVLIGVGGSWLFGIFGGMRTVIVPSSVVLAFASSAVVGVFFGYYPANAASQLDPIEALRHE